LFALQGLDDLPVLHIITNSIECFVAGDRRVQVSITGVQSTDFSRVFVGEEQPTEVGTLN